MAVGSDPRLGSLRRVPRPIRCAAAGRCARAGAGARRSRGPRRIFGVSAGVHRVRRGAGAAGWRRTRRHPLRRARPRPSTGMQYRPFSLTSLDGFDDLLARGVAIEEVGGGALSDDGALGGPTGGPVPTVRPGGGLSVKHRALTAGRRRPGLRAPRCAVAGREPRRRPRRGQLLGRHARPRRGLCLHPAGGPAAGGVRRRG